MAKLRKQYSHLVVSGRVPKHVLNRSRRAQRVHQDVPRRSHGERLLQEFDRAIEDHDRSRGDDLQPLRTLGTTIEIESEPGFSLRLPSLEQHSRHRNAPRPKWLLLRAQVNKKVSIERALVWVSDEYRAAFRSQFQQFVDLDTPTGRPRHSTLVANIAGIRPITAADLFTSDEPPPSEQRWWELCVAPTDHARQVVVEVSSAASLSLADMGMQFDEYSVLWIQARWDELAALPITAAPVVEVREPAFVQAVDGTRWEAPAVAFELQDLGIR